MPVEPNLRCLKNKNVLRDIIRVVVNAADVADLYPNEVITQWVAKNVLSKDGGWFDMVEEVALILVQEAAPGDELWEAMEMRVLAMKRSHDDE